MSQIDWSKAPDDATHAFPTSGVNSIWRREDPSNNGYWQAWSGGEWVPVRGAAPGGYIPRPTSWTGEGLPPVGLDIEWKSDYGWLGGKVVGHDQMVTIVRHNCGYSGLHSHQIRPVRTPEQVAAEERRKSAIALYEAVMNFGKLAFDRLPLDRQEHYLKLVDAGWQQVKS